MSGGRNSGGGNDSIDFNGSSVGGLENGFKQIDA